VVEGALLFQAARGSDGWLVDEEMDGHGHQDVSRDAELMCRFIKNSPGNKTLSSGGFALMPAHMNHYAFTGDQETTIVFYGQGPVEFKYVNPADDPRTAHASAQ
jgi:hypothetical protein